MIDQALTALPTEMDIPPMDWPDDSKPITEAYPQDIAPSCGFADESIEAPKGDSEEEEDDKAINPLRD